MKEKLALLGGKPVLRSPLPEQYHIGREEINLAKEVLKSGMLSGFVARYNEEFLGGPFVRKLERKFSSYFGTNLAVAMNSATSCLHAAVYALGICPGDEVILPPYTMSASAAAVLACSGVPVFVDINENNFCIDADRIEAAITSKTRAIMVVHLFGIPADIKRIMHIADKHNLRVIEDCAQAPGAMCADKFVGTFGDVGVYSLNRHKTIQTGEGGVAVTNDKAIALKLQLIRNHAESVVDEISFNKEFDLIGWNYKMTELEAAIGSVQIRRLAGLNAARVRNAVYINKRLKHFPWLITFRTSPDTRCVYYRYPLRFISNGLGIKRSTFARAMQCEGFLLNEGYVKPLYLQSIYRTNNTCAPYLSGIRLSRQKYQEGVCPVAEKLYRKELLLSPITHLASKKEDLNKFIAAIKKIEDNVKELSEFEKRN